MSDNVTKILESRKKPDESKENKFYLNVVAGNSQENFLEFQFNDGTQACFPYSDIAWFNYNPEGFLDIQFTGFLATIEGRNLTPIFTGIKNKQCAWVKEADSEMEDNSQNETFIKQIVLQEAKSKKQEAKEAKEAEET